MTQEQAILKLLKDGHWWKCSELLREVPCIVHSRIAGLRDRGHVIEHRSTGKGAAGSEYRLLIEEAAGNGSPGASSMSSALAEGDINGGRVGGPYMAGTVEPRGESVTPSASAPGASLTPGSGPLDNPDQLRLVA